MNKHMRFLYPLTAALAVSSILVTDALADGYVYENGKLQVSESQQQEANAVGKELYGRNASEESISKFRRTQSKYATPERIAAYKAKVNKIIGKNAHAKMQEDLEKSLGGKRGLAKQTGIYKKKTSRIYSNSSAVKRARVKVAQRRNTKGYLK